MPPMTAQLRQQAPDGVGVSVGVNVPAEEAH
jgi:hypothetical protein